MAIDTSGRVGIGTTSPAAPLHVASGNARFDGNVGIGVPTPPSFRLQVSQGNAMFDNNVSVVGALNVSGQVTLSGGSPGSGKVLTASNATGAASWKTCSVSRGACQSHAWENSVGPGKISCDEIVGLPNAFVIAIDEQSNALGGHSGNWMVQCCQISLTCN